MRDRGSRIIYIGKAANLRRRVSSYFSLRRGSGQARSHGARIQKLVNEIRSIDYKKTDSAIEALILEAYLIKKHLPTYNIRDKDDKSFLYVEVTEDYYPRVLLVRGKEKSLGKRYGPFTSASSIREALKIIRRLFPYSTHTALEIENAARPCFEYQIKLCPGTCAGEVSHRDYQKNIRHVKLFLEGKKKRILQSLDRDMKMASKKLDYERAGRLKRKIFSLKHIRDVAVIKRDDMLLLEEGSTRKSYRIEGYDISNISGTSAVGSMVVFEGDEPNKSEYRKFKIRTILGSNDTAMLKEVLERRFRRISHSAKKRNDGSGWAHPDLILIDGGRGQVNAVRAVLQKLHLPIPIIGIAKGPKRKKNEFIGRIPKSTSENTLIHVRDEAHRFAISYHKLVRRRRLLSK